MYNLGYSNAEDNKSNLEKQIDTYLENLLASSSKNLPGKPAPSHLRPSPPTEPSPENK